MKSAACLLVLLVLISVSSMVYAQERECDEMLDTLAQVLEMYVPELQEIAAPFIERASGGKAHLMTRIIHCADAMQEDTIRHDYYEMYVGESHSDHALRWYAFFIKENLKDILVYDPVKDLYIPLEQARVSKQWKEAWEARKL
jgi:hypothetical protein